MILIFKVKMDMAAVETLSHDGLVQALINDVRGADEGEFTNSSTDIALGSSDSSSGVCAYSANKLEKFSEASQKLEKFSDFLFHFKPVMIGLLERWLSIDL